MSVKNLFLPPLNQWLDIIANSLKTTEINSNDTLTFSSGLLTPASVNINSAENVHLDADNEFSSSSNIINFITSGNMTLDSADNIFLIAEHLRKTATEIISTATNIIERHTGYKTYSRSAITLLADANSVITSAMMVNGVISQSPTVDRTNTSDTAANILMGIPDAQINDCFNFTLINRGVANINFNAGANVSAFGSISPILPSTSKTYEIRVTGVSTVQIYVI